MFAVIAFALATPPQFTVVNKCPPVTVVNRTATAPQTVPPGHHAHRKADGTIIVHADSNYGNAAAHAGIVWPWPKVAYPGQVVRTAAPAVCPPGKP